MPAEPDPVLHTPSAGSTKSHWSTDVKFPVYAIAWIDDEHVVLAGGGGGSRTGVRNRLSLYRLSASPASKRSLTLLHSYTLAATEDAPMTIAYDPQTSSLVAGINSPAEELEKGTNRNLRVFEVRRTEEGGGWEIEESRRIGTLKTVDPDQYQKVSAFTRPPLPSSSTDLSSSSSSTRPSSDVPTLLAIGSTNSQLSLVRWPEAEEEVWPPAWYSSSGAGGEQGKGKEEEQEEVMDVDFDDRGELLVGTSPSRLSIFPTTKSPYLSRAPEAVQVIERPVLKKEMKCVFRGAKFGRLSTSTHLYTVVNASPLIPSSLSQKQRKAFIKKTPSKAFVSLWDAESWTLVKTRTVCQKPVTVFEVSRDGRRLAYGASDLSVGILDAETLRPILTILHAHDFPVTTLQFNPTGTTLISGSADNSIRIIAVPAGGAVGTGGGGSATTVWAVLVTLLVLLVAVAIQAGYVGEDVLRAARLGGMF
ncbi:hypothetical protein JCM11251_007655 [Rhodosporidiobolus azoricus]